MILAVKPSLSTTGTERGLFQYPYNCGLHRMVDSIARSPVRPSSTFVHLPNSSDNINQSTTRHPVNVTVTLKGWSNDEGLKEVETKFMELETKFKELETKFKELETKFMELEINFKELETKFNELHN